MTLPTYGRFSYNGVSFDALTKSKITTRYLYDEAGRTIIAAEHTLNVEGYVNGGASASCDSEMQSLHVALSMPGGELHYDNGRGFGGVDGTGLHVNDGIVSDLDFGPKPKVLDYRPLAALGAWFSWQCTTQIPNCPGAPTHGQPMALNYDYSRSIDDEGLTKISISGYLEIPLGRTAGVRTLADNVDNYLEKVIGPVPLGFKRMNSEHKLDKSKARLDFSWVDQELHDAYPDDCTRAEITHDVGWARSNLAWMTSTIRATLATRKGITGITALERFKAIVKSRLDAQVNGAGKVEIAKKGKDVAIFLDSIQYSEQVLTRTASFSLTYRICGGKIEDIIKLTNLFTAIRGIDFKSWKASLQSTAFAPRGVAGVKFANSSDAILDLCPGGQAALTAMGQVELKANGGAAPAPAQAVLQAVAGDFFQKIRVNDVPAPEDSWIAYQCDTQLIEDDRVIRHKPLTGAAGVSTGSQSPGTQAQTFGAAQKATGLPGGTVKATVPDVIQRVSAPSYTIRLTGAAIRIGHAIPVPALASIGGVALTQKDRWFSHGTIQSVGGLPVIGCKWSIDYILPQGPNTVPILANPAAETGAIT